LIHHNTLPINMASNKNSIESPIPAGGNVSAGKKDMEVTGDIDLDRARDHVLHGTMHGRGDKGFSEGKDSASGKLGGGDVSGGNKEMKLTGNRDLDRAREHVLGGRR
jgi:hypothetical protein